MDATVITETVSAQVRRAFQASAEDVFKAWIEPEAIRAWFAPGLGEVLQVDIQVGVHGMLSITQMQDGEAVTYHGTFRQLVYPRRLILGWTMEGDEGEDRIIVDIAPKPTGCNVVLTYEMDAEYAEFLKGAELTWAVMLHAMAEYLEA